MDFTVVTRPSHPQRARRVKYAALYEAIESVPTGEAVQIVGATAAELSSVLNSVRYRYHRRRASTGLGVHVEVHGLTALVWLEPRAAARRPHVAALVSAR